MMLVGFVLKMVLKNSKILKLNLDINLYIASKIWNHITYVSTEWCIQVCNPLIHYKYVLRIDEVC